MRSITTLTKRAREPRLPDTQSTLHVLIHSFIDNSIISEPIDPSILLKPNLSSFIQSILSKPINPSPLLKPSFPGLFSQNRSLDFNLSRFRTENPFFPFP